jgi:hypothetical protein
VVFLVDGNLLGLFEKARFSKGGRPSGWMKSRRETFRE